MPGPRDHIGPNTCFKYRAKQYYIVFGLISQWWRSGSSPKSNQFVLVTHPTCPLPHPLNILVSEASNYGEFQYRGFLTNRVPISSSRYLISTNRGFWTERSHCLHKCVRFPHHEPFAVSRAPLIVVIGLACRIKPSLTMNCHRIENDIRKSCKTRSTPSSSHATVNNGAQM